MEGATFTDVQHRKEDEEITLALLDIFPVEEDLSQKDCAMLLQRIIQYSEGKLRVAFMDNVKAIDLMRRNPELESALKNAWRTKNYSEIRTSELLTVPELDDDEPVGQMEATENAWTTQYRGEAPAALWTRIKKTMKEADRYARYLTIVQSSGTGKSRLAEELSKTRLVISVNLRDSDETGYPPPDKIASSYLSGTRDQTEARVHAVAFLRAIFKEASKLITDLRKPLSGDMDRHDQIASLFSKYMSEGMEWDSHGEKRRSFYDKVGSSARKLEGEIKQAFATKKSDLERQLASVGICEAFKELIATLPSGRTSPRHYHTNPEPLVILAFDEARTLTNAQSNEPWSHFSELLHALRALNHQPLFSLFLTTTGNVKPFVPSLISRNGPSSRIYVQALSPTRPFTEVGFDHFAFKDQFDLRVVSDDEHISHFGRPLWATRYKEGNDTVKSQIIQFAALKLRAGKTYWPGKKLCDIEKLACLAQRLPIEFRSVTYASKMTELQLVEGHMRILLQLDARLESLSTVSASEPILSEAAYWMMDTDTTFQAAETLNRCLDRYAVHKGDRGELLVMLLFTLARDRAIGHPDEFGRPRQRWCSVPDFMSALFKFEHHPSSDASLKELFADSKVFFNHWVKVDQYEMVNVQYLAHLMRRGASLLCATNQTGMDGIIPFLLSGYDISPKNIGVIIWQGKNDPKYADEPEPGVLEAMDPYALGILNPGDDIPIIRIVFALASKNSCITRVTCRQAGFKSCDFWVAGISPTVFSSVGDQDASIWTALLRATWEDIYKENPEGKADKTEEDLRRSMNPGTAGGKHHWENWASINGLMAMANTEKENKNKKNKNEKNESTAMGNPKGNKKDERMDIDSE